MKAARDGLPTRGFRTAAPSTPPASPTHDWKLGEEHNDKGRKVDGEERVVIVCIVR